MQIQPSQPVQPVRPATDAQPTTAQTSQAAAPATAPDRLSRSSASAPQPAILNLNLLPAPADYQQAVARLQQRVAADLSLQDRSQPRDSYLRDNYQSQFVAQPEPTPKGTVIMLHGYTAGPWQYDEAVSRFAEAGYNVYAPRLPGHGFMKPDGTPTGEDMVKPWERERYDQFIDQVYREAAALGGPVQVIGLSGGGNLALQMAEKHPQITGVVAMAPYVGPNATARQVNNAVNTLARHSFLKLPRLLDLIPYNRNIRNLAQAKTPHTQGTLANAQAMFSMGTELERVKVPVKFFTTEGDLLSGPDAVKDLYPGNAGRQNGWTHFPAEAQVPHAMASPKQFQGAEAIWDQVFDTIEAGAAPKPLPGIQP
ncbi:MAG: alpha/beta fold hydrolase [Candidatus Sericytochromatia bacterium]|nr:alpha/beta fold hydrolase [Candidatus Sericytochromatia bacterium]